MPIPRLQHRQWLYLILPTPEHFWFLALDVLILAKKISKNTFPKEFFNEFWVIVEDYEYIYIIEVKFWNFYFFVILLLGVKHFFFLHPQMLIYAN